MHSMYGGLPCEGPELEVQHCKVKECPVDCEITAWAQTGPCDKQCGTGSMPQSREITVNSDHGGEACPSDLERSVPCNTHPCPVACVLSGWTETGTCSQTCGGGVVKKVRTMLIAPMHGGLECHPEQEKWEECNTEPCPVNCEWAPWTGWSKCSAFCGEGTSERTRVKTMFAAHGGKECNGRSRQEMGCTAPPCAVDGVWDLVERFDRRGTEPFELFRSEFGQNS